MEAIDSSKKADALNKACLSCERKEPLNVFVQVNTSNEQSKSGVLPENCAQVCRHIHGNCPQLKLQGLMTIGMFGRDPSEANPDFEVTFMGSEIAIGTESPVILMLWTWIYSVWRTARRR